MVRNTVKGPSSCGRMGKEGGNQARAGRSMKNKGDANQTATADDIF